MRSTARCIRGLAAGILAAVTVAQAQLKPVPLTPEWSARIRALAPARPVAEPRAERTVLVFSLMTGFQHWVTPHTAEVIKVLGDKSGAFTVLESRDIEMFTPERIRAFDAVVLNNTCSQRNGRNLFMDVLGGNVADPAFVPDGRYKGLTDEARKAKAEALEQSLLDYVAGGGGLAVIHGGITMLNDSAAFGAMVGAGFDFHPKQQEFEMRLVEPEHPLLRAFEGRSFTHVDEPYLFKGAYARKDFRPLLEMDTSRMGSDKRVAADTWHAAWIRAHGQGRVFFLSPSHNAQSFEDPRMLGFMLDALLDVTHPEPPSADSPLWTQENIQMTAHLAGSHNDEIGRVADLVLEEFKAWQCGRPLRYAITWELLERMA